MRDFNRDNRGGSRGGRRFDSRGGGRREMHDVVCSNCGKDCKVPFRPTGDKPVYCSECFGERGGNDRRSSGRGDRYNQKPGQDNQRQFDDLHKKMDVIIDTLMYIKKTLKEEPTEMVEKEPVESVKKDKPKKKKKAKKKTEKK